MFVFDNVSDKDARSYGYELYESDQVSGSYPNIAPITNATIYSSGTSGANVFTVAVENSTDSTTRRYYGRIRTIDSTGNPSDWSPIVQSDQENPLISNQYIASITAAKITAGTIGAHEIILTQAGSPTSYSAPANTAVIRSSNYQANTAGWLIRGDGFAEFDSTVIRGGLKAGAVYINAHNRWKADANGNVISNAEFKVGSSTKNLYWDGTNLTFTGNLSAAGGTFSGNLSGVGGTFAGNLSAVGGTFTGNLSAAGGTFTGNVSIGSGSSIFKADTNGIYLGNATFASAPFRVNINGGLVSTNANISGEINATAGSIGGWNISGESIISSDGGITLFTDGSTSAIIAQQNETTFTYINSDGTIHMQNGDFGGTDLSGYTLSVTDALMRTTTVSGSGITNNLGAFSIGSNISCQNTLSGSKLSVNYITSIPNVTSAGIRYSGANFGPNQDNAMGLQWTGSQAYVVIDNVAGQYLGGSVFSDRRYKLNINEPTSDWTNKILNDIKIWQFNRINPLDESDLHIYPTEIGVIADEFKQIFPQWESSSLLADPDGADAEKVRAVDYTGIIPGLVLIVQKFDKEIKELKNRIAILENNL